MFYSYEGRVFEGGNTVGQGRRPCAAHATGRGFQARHMLAILRIEAAATDGQTDSDDNAAGVSERDAIAIRHRGRGDEDNHPRVSLC